MRFYQQLAAHTVYQIIARIASSGASFLITFFVARHFGIFAYGDFAKVTAYISIFYLFVDLGLNAIFLQKNDSHLRFRDLFYTRILLSLAVVVISNAIAFFLPYDPVSGIGFSPLARLGIAIFSGTLITESILFSAFAVFQRKRIYQKFMVATVVGSLATIIFVGIFGVLQFSLVFIFFAFLLGAVIEAGFSLFYTDEALFPIHVDPVFVKRLAIETFPVALMLLFNMVYFRIDMILLSFLKPSSDVAFYDIAYRVFDFLIALPLFLSNVLYPKLIVDEKNNRSVKAKLSLYVFSFALLGLLVAIPVWFVSPLLFNFIKPQLIGAMIPMRILLISLPVFFATNILQWILLSKKKQKILAWMYILLAISNVVLNLVFIPQYSYVASAIITGSSELLVACVMWVILLKEK